MASREIFLPTEGRATFTGKPIKGVRKDPEAVMSRAGFRSILFSIFPILAVRRSQNQQQKPETSSPLFHEEVGGTSKQVSHSLITLMTGRSPGEKENEEWEGLGASNQQQINRNL
jgi:hypothetical protein